MLCLEEYDSIKELLVEIAPRENSSQVNHWNTGGQIYLDYIKLWEKFNDIKVGVYNSLIMVKVVAFCTYIHSEMINNLLNQNLKSFLYIASIKNGNSMKTQKVSSSMFLRRSSCMQNQQKLINTCV